MMDAQDPGASARKTRPDQEVRPLPALQWIGWILKGVGFFSPVLAARWLIWVFSFPGRKARHYREDHLLRSARRFLVETPFGRIRTYTWGHGERRVLLLHGWQSRGTALRYVVPALMEAGFCVVAMDAPGHGESSGCRMSLDTYAGAIRDIDRAQGPFEAAVTHSFGARALAFAIAFLPHSWHIHRIVMLSVPASVTDIFEDFFRQTKVSSAIVAEARKLARKKLGRPLEETEIHRMGNRLGARVLIIHDEMDDVVPISEAERIAGALPEASLIRTSGFGHYRLVKDARVWQWITDFLCGS